MTTQKESIPNSDSNYKADVSPPSPMMFRGSTSSIGTDNGKTAIQSQQSHQSSDAPRIRRVKFSTLASSKSSESNSTENRNLQGVEYDGDYDFIDMGEDVETYFVDVYQCNEALNRISDSILEPKVAGDFIRICIRPTAMTIERGVLLRRIDQFKFTKYSWQGAPPTTGDSSTTTGGSPIHTQQVVVAGREQENTLMTCEPGSEICAFKTVLSQDFFREDGTVNGEGYVFLEFGTNKEADVFGDVGIRRNNRKLQDTDVDFAGIKPLEIQFPVMKSISTGFVAGANDSWEEMNQGARYGIIVAIIAILLCFICALGYCCMFLYKREKEMEDRVDGNFPKEIKVNPRASFFDLFRAPSWNGNLGHSRDDDINDGDSVVNGGTNRRPPPNRRRPPFSFRRPRNNRDNIVGTTPTLSSDDSDTRPQRAPARPPPRLIQNKFARPSNRVPETSKPEVVNTEADLKEKKKPFLRPRPPPVQKNQAEQSPRGLSQSLHSPSTPSGRPNRTHEKPQDLSTSLHSPPAGLPAIKQNKVPRRHNSSAASNRASPNSVASSRKSQKSNTPKKGKSLPKRKQSMSVSDEQEDTTRPKLPVIVKSQNQNKPPIRSNPKKSPSSSKKNPDREPKHSTKEDSSSSGSLSTETEDRPMSVVSESQQERSIPVSKAQGNKKQTRKSKSPRPAEDTQSEGNTSNETEENSLSKDDSPPMSTINVDKLVSDDDSDSEQNDGGDQEDDIVSVVENEAKAVDDKIKKKGKSKVIDKDDDDSDDESIDFANYCSAVTTDVDDDKDDSSMESAGSDSDYSDDSDCYPDNFDVAFGVDNHVGTMVLVMTIRKVAGFNNGAPFSKAIFQQIEIDLKGRSCYKQEDDVWKRARRADRVKYFQTCYDKEKLRFLS
mmetsp:Transcript_53336/g.129663  ORF Transcript_53336/g.129663 Transcript_53336/m.129663 type:complete len:889 (+) Transcript_53336:134-2800(+)